MWQCSRGGGRFLCLWDSDLLLQGGAGPLSTPYADIQNPGRKSELVGVVKQWWREWRAQLWWENKG